MENLFFCYCDEDGIGFGSEEYFGLFLDKSLSSGSTFSCKTYANDQLSKKHHFAIKKVEVWGFE